MSEEYPVSNNEECYLLHKCNAMFLMGKLC